MKLEHTSRETKSLPFYPLILKSSSKSKWLLLPLEFLLGVLAVEAKEQSLGLEDGLRSSRLETESLRSARLAVNGVPYEDDEVLDMIQQAERTGAYKALHWLSFEFTDGMTVDDIVQTVQFALCCVGENLWKDFNNQYALLTNISKRVEQRKQEQKASC